MYASRKPWHFSHILSCTALILPAITFGVLAMVHGDISAILWGQQLAVWVLFALLARPLSFISGKLSPGVWSVLLLAALAATFLYVPVGGARRWLDMGIIHINAAKLVLPALTVILYRIKHPFALLFAAAAILSFQPDLCQLSAFAAAFIPLLWLHRNNRLYAAGSVLALIALVIRCLLSPVAIEPVAYCEGILTMLGQLSPLLMAAGVVSLAAVPAFFVFLFLRGRQAHLLALAVYYAVTMLYTLTGNEPVPFMGYGLSPIVGYFLGNAFCMLHNHAEKRI